MQLFFLYIYFVELVADLYEFIWSHTDMISYFSYVFAYTPLTVSFKGGPSCLLFWILGSWSSWGSGTWNGLTAVGVWYKVDVKHLCNLSIMDTSWRSSEVNVSGFGRGVNSSFSCQWHNSVHIRKTFFSFSLLCLSGLENTGDLFKNQRYCCPFLFF